LSKPKLWELDIVRAVAIAAVLLIHGTSSSRMDLPLGSRSSTFYFAINNLSIFAVPVFIFLSGLVLFYSYSDTWTVRRTPGFYRKRLQFILIPYLIWSVFYYIYNQWLDPTVKIHFSLSQFADLLPWGLAAYHLYFMVIIMQMYALFPLLISLVKLWRPLGRYLWLFGILVQAGYFVYRQFEDTPLQYGDRLFITYFAVFCIGGSIGMHYERFVGWLNRNIWWMTAAAASVGLVYLLITLQAFRGMRVEAWEYELMFNLYPTLVAMALIWIGRHCVENAPRLTAVLSSFGAASFGIYFTHVALMSYYGTLVSVPVGQAGYHIAVWGNILLIFTVPWAAVHLLKKVKGSWLLFGK